MWKALGVNKKKILSACALVCIGLLIFLSFLFMHNVVDLIPASSIKKYHNNLSSPIDIFNLSFDFDDDTVAVDDSIWFDVMEWANGIGNWAGPFLTLLQLAIYLNATVVEPCISSTGRMQSCSLCKNENDIRLGQIYNMTPLRRMHHKLVPYSDYKKHIANSDKRNVTASFYSLNMTAPVNRTASCSPYSSRMCHLLKELFLPGNRIVRVYGYRGGLLDWKVTHPSLPQNIFAPFHFRQEHFQVVDTFLELLKVSRPYSVIHWRAEKSDMNFLECAGLILLADKTMVNASAHDSVLMSNLNSNSNLRWGPSKRFTDDSTAALASLKLLQQMNVKKLDILWSKENDTKINLAFLSAWDIILAMKADDFATCTKACNETSVCSRCNYKGGFGNLVVQFREREGKSSHVCWPH